jgi:hypothetical protein
MEKPYFFDAETIQSTSVDSELGMLLFDNILRQKIDTDLSLEFIKKKIGALEKGGYELQLSTLKYDVEKAIFIIDAYLSHPQFYNYFMQIEGKYRGKLSKNDVYSIFKQPIDIAKWQFSWVQNKEISLLKKCFSKPIKPPFDIENIDFAIEYWTSDHPNSTYLTIEFKTKTKKEILENVTKEYFKSILNWGNFISNFGHVKEGKNHLSAFQIDDEALLLDGNTHGEPSFQVKEIDTKTLKISLAFNEFKCYWTVEWYLRWLSYSMPNQIKKVTFEWIF